MKFKQFLPVLILAATVSFTGCKEKDATVKTRVEEKLQSNQETSGTMVSVNDGVATLSGQVSSENGKMESESLAKGTKGVKSVVNNLSVMAPVAPVVVTADDPLMMALKDATKDHPGVNASVMNGTVTLTGSISKSDNVRLMQKISALNPGKIDNQLVIK
ncbi:MAG: BON domain-containing protein [Ferruginibacter sp.]